MIPLLLAPLALASEPAPDPVTTEAMTAIYGSADVQRCFAPLFDDVDGPGRVEVTTTVGTNGGVELEVAGPAGLDSLQACLWGATRSIRVTAPAEPRKMLLLFFLDESAPEAPKGVRVARPPTEPRRDLELMLYKHKDLKKCFVPLFKSGSPPSKVELVFAVGESGRPEQIRVESADPLLDGFEACMQKAVEEMVFYTLPRGEEQRFPFVLNR